MFFPSPRNSIPAQAKILDELQCETMITSQPPSRAANEAIKKCNLRDLIIPDVEDLMKTASRPMNHMKPFAAAQAEPLLTIHTSGSTGLPKPMTMTHASAVAGMKMFTMQPPQGRRGQNDLITGKRVYSMLPPFHVCHHQNNQTDPGYFLTATPGRLSGLPLDECGTIQYSYGGSYFVRSPVGSGAGRGIETDKN